MAITNGNDDYRGFVMFERGIKFVMFMYS